MPAPATRALSLSLLAAIAGLVALPAAHAQDNARDDRFTLRLSAFYPEAQLRFSGDGTATDGTESATFGGAETLDVGSRWRPRGALGFRISDRQALVGNYYDYARTNSWGLDADSLNPGNFFDEVDLPDFPVDTPAVDLNGRVNFSLASLNYEYSFISNEAFQWGLGLGVTYAELEGRANVNWSGTDEIDAGEESYRWKRSGLSPGLHTRLTWRPSDSWRVGLEGQYMDTRWGNFLDERGHFERAGLIVEYLLTERFGIHVGYDWFRLKLKDNYTASFDAVPEVGVDPIRVQGELQGQLKVHGPMAGVTFRF
ncbi:hypothetical protein [Luteimonas abyssi]|uniref:hypothetical protein n=1 Tax=Luteimonas abyssi TaxID=1247514 RepID=UPI000737C96D|nr:hypothetical protein [Luteimonas abyssi]